MNVNIALSQKSDDQSNIRLAHSLHLYGVLPYVIYALPGSAAYCLHSQTAT